MRIRRFRNVHSRWTNVVAALLIVLALGLLLTSCGDPTPTPQVMIVTATFTPEQAAQVATATFTPETQAAIQAATATFTPETIVQEESPEPPPTQTPYPTYTPLPTYTPVPPTDTPIPTDTPAPTNTPKPTKKPKPKPTNTEPPQAYPPPVLLSPEPNFNCYNIGGCYFSWSWGRSLKANEYFQVQIIGPGDEHRGIHPPTKGFSFQSDYNVYQIVRDWCDPRKYCHVKWTVAVVEWDGQDPSKIGRTLIEAPWRDVIL